MKHKWDKQKLQVDNDLEAERIAFEQYWNTKKELIEQENTQTDSELKQFTGFDIREGRILPKSLQKVVHLFRRDELANQSSSEIEMLDAMAGTRFCL